MTSSGDASADTPRKTAKLFMRGRRQAVWLPADIRFEGSEVQVSRVGEKVVLESIRQPAIDVKAWRARLDALGAADFLPDGLTDDPPIEAGDAIRFDESEPCSVSTPTSSYSR